MLVGGDGGKHPEPLGRLRVLDLSQSVAGQFCARLFADHGAQVTLVEPPAGSATRIKPPRVRGEDGEVWSALFWHVNLGKRSEPVDTTNERGLRFVGRLAAGADVVVADNDLLGDAARSGLWGRALCWFSTFGKEGPWADWRGDEMIVQAMAGTMNENRCANREPLYGCGDRASYASGVIGYMESLAVLLRGERAHTVIDVSVAETAASMSYNRVTQYSYSRCTGEGEQRTSPTAIIRCADSWVHIFAAADRWAGLCRALGLPELADDPRFCTSRERLRNWPEFEVLAGQRLQIRRGRDIVEAAQREKAIVAECRSPKALFTDPQLQARRFWDRSDDHGWPVLPRLGPMFRLRGTPSPSGGSAPSLGADRADLVDDGMIWTENAALKHRGDAPSSSGEVPLPLAGIRVLDLTWAWAGPMAGRLVAALGAEVIKLEGPGRLDGWRGAVNGSYPSWYPDEAFGPDPWNRCCLFNTQNQNKVSAGIDLKTAKGVEIARTIASNCDAVIANFSAGTLERIGLGWETLHRANPRTILLEMPGYGTGGPFGRYVALGASVEFMSGMSFLTGYGDGQPMTTGPAYPDPMGGFNGAAALLTALHAREITGEGQHVELAQREAAMHWIGEEIIAAIASGEVVTPDGNRRPDMVPHDVFPARGRDQWIAIAVSSDLQFLALCDVMDAPNSIRRLASVQQRAEHRVALSASLARWTAGQDKWDLAHLLQRAGVPAAPVCDGKDVYESSFLRSRGLVYELEHPSAGRHSYQGVPLHIEGVDLKVRRPAPTFGEHTKEVLYEYAGIGEQEYLRLEADGIVAMKPRMDRDRVEAKTAESSNR
ncbi:MAG: CoA transferase [Acidimicrobiales bacterium]